MRPLIAALLFAVAVSASAETPFSVDFYYNQFEIGQGGWANPYLKVTGTLPGATSVIVTWSYAFAVGTPVSGKIELTSKSTNPNFYIDGPITSTYIGTVPGTASISYQAPGQQQPETKSIPLTLYDTAVGVDMENDRVLESDSSPHAIPFRLRKSAGVPLTVKFTTQSCCGNASPSDYTLLDPAISLPAGATSGELHYTITPDAIAEGDEQFYLLATVYDGAKEIGRGFVSVTIKEKEVRAMFVPDQLNVFAGDPFSLMVLLSKPMAVPRYSPRTSMSFATSNPSVVSGLPSPLTVGDSTVVGTMTASAVGPGDAIVTAQDADAGNVIPGAAHIHVYDGRFSFGELKTLVIAPGQSIAVPLEMTPPPPEPTDFFAIEDRLAGFVDVDSFVTVDTAGHGTLTIRGKKIGTTIVAIESPGRRRISGIDVVVKNAAPPPPPPPPSPSRRRSARH